MAVRIAASCPSCGAPIVLDAAETAVRCDRCASAHLALRGAGTTVVQLGGRTTSEDAGALARGALDDEVRRRGRGGPGAVVESAVEFEAPVRVLLARLHEAAVVRGASGDPAAEVTSRLVERAVTALQEPLGLPTTPPLGEIDARALVVVSRRTATAPPFDAGDAAFEADAVRVQAAHPGVAPPLVRHCVASPLARLLVLRPCRLVSVSSGRSRAGVLVDDADRQATALLSQAATEALRDEIVDRALPASSPPALRPMRCPACASDFPLDREGQLRICPGCRRAWLVTGRRLQPVAYHAELPPNPRGRLLVPAWRLPFALLDPRDGGEASSVADVARRCGEAPVEAARAPDTLDVPAFRLADRRRERGGAQRLLSLPPASFPLFEGPARGEAGFPDPRLVGAIGPGEAAAVARHALLAALRPETVALASARRLKALLFDAPLRTGPPRLVLRALRRAEAEGS